ncbi:protein SSUH2 homolog [Mya arenaria]|uniref:protein SSUH2 homolog n=1 Tax=Mya arenaria TaxID=6604 RepID=UPI0022DEAB7A|nr:protein SSUH2 homolog [Mya arenaria]
MLVSMPCTSIANQFFTSMSKYPDATEGDVQLEWKGNVPDDDVDEDFESSPAPPSAPPLEKMDPVPGYNHIGAGGFMAPPPAYEAVMREQPTREQILGADIINENDAREVLLQHVAEHCCYGSRAAKQLKFTELEHTSAFHYKLETFAEGRTTEWTFVPYTGQMIDGPENGPAPMPWDIYAIPGAEFTDHVKQIEVPHTSSVKPCHHCSATGRIRCHKCLGRGRVKCSSCYGKGYKYVTRQGDRRKHNCTWCHGSGKRKCQTCCASGMITCTACAGHCQLKCFIQLSVKWSNHIDDHVVERTELPNDLIKKVTGHVAFNETQFRVWPINHFPDADVNTASNQLVNKHATAFGMEKILMQRHHVQIVPVTQALYRWKNVNSDFFVYGYEKKVYAPKYPQQCCCGCSLL